MSKARRILASLCRRPAALAWVIALLVGGVLASATATVEVLRARQARLVGEQDGHMYRLFDRIIPLHNKPLADFEAQVLNGRRLVGEATKGPLGADPLRVPEIFMAEVAAQPADNPATRPAGRTSFRALVDGADVDPEFAGWTVRVHFVNDRLRSASAWNPNRIVPRPIPGAVAVRSALGTALVLAAALAVVCLVTAAMAGGRWRRQVAGVGLAAAALVVGIGALQPTHWSQPLLRGDAVRTSWLALTAALGLCFLLPARVRVRREPDHPTCGRCGYDLTGNESGVCPECGTRTPTGLVTRWAEQAAAVAAVADDTGRYPGNFLTESRLVELKQWPGNLPEEAARFAVALAAVDLRCYRYLMTDPRPTPDAPNNKRDTYPEPTEVDLMPGQAESDTPGATTPPGPAADADGVGAAPDAFDDPPGAFGNPPGAFGSTPIVGDDVPGDVAKAGPYGGEDGPQVGLGGFLDAAASDAQPDAAAFTCPTCGHTFQQPWLPDNGLLSCPACASEFFATTEVSDADRELAEKIEVDRRRREEELNEVRIRQVLTERRSLFRTRTYFVVLGGVAAVAGVQLGLLAWTGLREGRLGLREALYLAAIALMALGVVAAVRKIRQLNAELRVPALPEPDKEPDFSTLSDGTQRFDEAVEQLRRLYRRE